MRRNHDSELSKQIKNRPMYSKLICSVPGCTRLTMGATATGLAAFHCRKHVDHKARHGSHWKSTYRAIELKPYIRAATSYIKLRAETDRFIKASAAEIARILDESGSTELATRLKGKSARERARIALARLRVAGVKPERIIAIVIALTALIEEDPNSVRTKEYRAVSISKLLHRRASGTGWASSSKRFYPRASGPVLRLIGRAVEEACSWALDQHLSAILALKVKRYGRHPALLVPEVG